MGTVLEGIGVLMLLPEGLRRTRRATSNTDDAPNGDDEGARQRWVGFGLEARGHVRRLAADRRDGGVRKAGAAPDLYRLPTGEG